MNNKDKIGCLFVILIITLLICAAVYDEKQNSPSIPLEPERLELQQVMEHESDHYSVKYKAENNELITIDFGRLSSEGVSLRIIADVPEGESIWALLNRAKTPRGVIHYFGGEIHVHSGKDINGGGWNHGKFGRGQTVSVESAN